MNNKFKLLIKGFALLGVIGLLSTCGGDGGGSSTGGFTVSPAPSSIDIMMHSANDFTPNPIAAGSDQYHAFFEAPGFDAITVTETTDLALLNDFDLLYISQDSVDTLSPADMATVRDWTNAGGNLVIIIRIASGITSAFGSFVGTSYEFSSVGSLDSENIVVTNATHRLLNHPNVLSSADLSNWNNSAHGAFDSVGSAYSCIADDDDGVGPLPTLCATPFGSGAIIITGLDPECDCHDDHLSGGTTAGSELMENFVMLLHTSVAPPPPTKLLVSERNASTVLEWEPVSGTSSTFHSVQTNDADCNALEGSNSGWVADHKTDSFSSFTSGTGTGVDATTSVPYAYPKHITVFNNNIFVMSRNDETIHYYNQSGTELGTISLTGTDGQGMATDGTFLYASVWDGANSTINQYDSTLLFQQTFANPSGMGGLNNIIDIAYDAAQGTFHGLATTGEGGTGTESDTVLEFDMGGAVLATRTLPVLADGIGQSNCN